MPLGEARIAEGLGAAGLAPGDTVLVHSDVGRFGRIAGAKSRREILEAWVRVFLAVLGPEGTLAVPTFSYSFCRGEVYDMRNTPGETGLLGEQVRSDSRALRSTDPIFSIAAIGRNAERLTRGLGKSVFGQESSFGRLHGLGGKILFLGVSPYFCTYIHYVEQAAGVDYRYFKTFHGKIIDAEGRCSSDEAEFFVRDVERGVATDVAPFLLSLEDEGIMRKAALGPSELRLVSSDDIYRIGLERLRKEPYCFLRHPPLPRGAEPAGAAAGRRDA